MRRKRSQRQSQAKRKYPTRDINGIVNIDKPIGLSSNQVLQKAKAIFSANKAGHTGNLDPLATGVLPICFGHATKLSQYLLDSDKSYQAGIILGVKTTTGDKEGEVIEPVDNDLSISVSEIEQCLLSLVGEIEQVPPMHSALKKDGQPLYKLARQGIEVERKARKITIYELKLLEFNFPEIIVDVSCSKGTYIRTLAEDIGTYFDTGAHLSSLRRTKAGPFNLDDSIELEKLQELKVENPFELDAFDNYLLEMDRVLTDLPKITLTDGNEVNLRFGRKINLDDIPDKYKMVDNNSSISLESSLTELSVKQELIRLYNESKLFLGLGIILTEKASEDTHFYLQPKRLFI